MDIAITKMSSKGQIVIPQEMRQDIKEGQKLVVIQAGHQIIIEKVDDLSESLKEDLIFAKRTEEAWKKYEKGEFKSMPMSQFLKELKKW